jgi:hypothetical protein
MIAAAESSGEELEKPGKCAEASRTVADCHRSDPLARVNFKLEA